MKKAKKKCIIQGWAIVNKEGKESINFPIPDVVWGVYEHPKTAEDFKKSSFAAKFLTVVPCEIHYEI